MTNLLALIDGSIYSQSVCDHAAWAAGRAGLPIELLHVLGRREMSSEPANLSGSIGLGARTALLEELVELDAQKAKLALKRGRMILDEAQERLRGAGAKDISAKLRHGDLIDTVQEFEGAAAAIILGKRGEAADFAKLHLGSNLERVVRSVNKPVLVASRAFRPIKRFLIAFDGGVSAMKAVDYVARSPLFAGLECGLLMAGAESSESRKRLDGAATQLSAAGYAVTADLAAASPDQAILARIEAGSVDLLVMGAYGHSRIRSLIIGSTTTEMIRSCKIPVMLFR